MANQMRQVQSILPQRLLKTGNRLWSMRRFPLGYSAMPWKRWSLTAGLTLAVMPSLGSTDNTIHQNHDKAALVQREGHDLSQAILQAYSRGLTSSRANLYVSGLDITSDVSHYIKTGMSFDQAEEILRAAGLTVSGRPGLEGWSGNHIDSNRADKFAVSAYCYEYFNRSNFYRFFRPIYKRLLPEAVHHSLSGATWRL